MVNSSRLYARNIETHTKYNPGKVLYVASIIIGGIALAATTVYCVMRTRVSHNAINNDIFGSIEEDAYNDDYRACEIYIDEGIKEHDWLGTISKRTQYSASGAYVYYLMEQCYINFNFDKPFIDNFNTHNLYHLSYSYGHFETISSTLSCHNKILNITNPSKELHSIYIAKFIDAFKDVVNEGGKLSNKECEKIANKMLLALKSSHIGILCQHNEEVLYAVYQCKDFKALLDICNYRYTNIEHLSETLKQRNMTLDDITVGMVRGGVKKNKSHMKAFLKLLNDRGLNDEQAAGLLEWYVNKTDGGDNAMNMDIITAYRVSDTVRITLFGQKLVSLQIMMAVKENCELYGYDVNIINILKAVIVNYYACLRRELMHFIIG